MRLRVIFLSSTAPKLLRLRPQQFLPRLARRGAEGRLSVIVFGQSVVISGGCLLAFHSPFTPFRLNSVQLLMSNVDRHRATFNPLTADDLRSKYLAFFKERG